VIGVLAISLNMIGIGLAPSYWVLLSLSVAGGFADALVFGLPLAIAGVMFTGDTQRKAMGWTIGSLSSASIIGTPILTSVGSVTGWRAALVGAGILSASAAWFIYQSLPADKRRPRTTFRLGEIAGAYRPLIRHRPTLRIYATSALRSITWIGFITYLGAYLADELDLGTSSVGLVYMASGIGYAIGSVLGSRMPLISPRTMLAMSCLFAAAILGAVLSVPVVWLTVLLVIAGSLVSSFGAISLVSVLADESPAGTGTTMVLNGSMINLGASGGALIGGILISLGGYQAMGIGLPLFSVVAAVLVRWKSSPEPTARPLIPG
jgi:DHA1 family inner membrane transport protein